MRIKGLSLILTCLGILTMLAAALYSGFNASSREDLARHATAKVKSRLAAGKAALTRLETEDFSGWDANLFLTDKIGLYRFRNDSLVNWNNSQWAIAEKPLVFNKNQGFVKLSHGYFLYVKCKSKNGINLALSLIKPAFSLQNNYLNNNFSSWLDLPEEAELDNSTSSSCLIELDNEALFSIKLPDQQYFNQKTDAFCLGLFILGLLVTMVGLLLVVQKNEGKGIGLLVILAVPLARFLMLAFNAPGFLYRTFLYNPRLFGNAQSFMNGFLGDILLNSFTFLFVALALHYTIRKTGNKKRDGFSSVLISALVFLFFNQFNVVIVSLVNNSTLNFNFLSLFDVQPAVFVALSSLAVLSLALFVCLNKLIVMHTGSWQGFAWFVALVTGICLLQQLISGQAQLIQSYWPLLFAIPAYLLHRSGQKNIALSLGMHVLAMSVVTSTFLNFYISKNQALDLGVLMQKLGERQDEILESEFAGLPQKINEDENLKNLVNLLPDSEKELEQKLKQKYFAGYFDRYEIGFSLFDKNCSPLLPSKQAVLQNEGFFEDRIKYYSQPVMDGLYFVKDFPDNTQYIAQINIGDYKLFALLEAKQFEEVGSFPDLFLDQSLQKQDKLKTFDYAVYRSGQNTNRFGDFNYPYFFRDSLTLTKTAPGYIHYYYEPEPSTQIIISQASRNWSYFFTFNSYLLLFFSLLTYAGYLVYAFAFTGQFNNSSLTRRVQTIIILLLLLAMSAVGITSGNLVTAQFESENKKQLEEKTSIIVSELNGQFTPGQLFDESQKELLNNRLREYSRLFNTPISLFNRQGVLFNSSEPKLYDYGLAAKYANPTAFNELRNNLSSAISVNEKAGNLNYLSLYTPLFDKNNTLIGYINLPYFARVSDLANELSQIISALINVYVILFVLSILAGLILSGYITQPLRLIKQQLAKITLGTQNEKITWQSNDEIGKLVAEYNLMLLKLEESANLLAKSERESAWREMAKQVAHEIKNPLTPMKLNLQYLQHLMKSNPEDFKERFEKASAGIIEQIDALASIATEFSNFAKLPGASLQTLNLVELINSTVHIFDGQKNVRIVNNIPDKELFIEGDREQCLRVFNNILKNAVQATEESEAPLIEIECNKNHGRLIISIKDNGCGIDEYLKPKLFSPNFTTKSTGSGLGLAMVKSIMEGFGGSIRFESEKNQGATFYLEFKTTVVKNN